LRVHVGDPRLVPRLLEYFEQRADCVVVQVGEAEIEVSLIGSYREETHDEEVRRLLALFWDQAERRASSGNGAR
jgi:hypothetical protein